MAGNSSSSVTTSCGIYELLIFLAAIITGTLCSLCSKTMMELHAVGSTGEVERFTKPLFQTFGMFVGMLFGLVMHGIVLAFQIPFPGYEHSTTNNEAQTRPPLQTTTNTTNYGSTSQEERNLLLAPSKPPPLKPFPTSPTKSSSSSNGGGTPLWMYFFLAIPSIFDLCATALCMVGLCYLDVSIYQLLRGSGLIFVALMKQHVLGDRLYRFQWLGVAWNVVSVILVGATAILNSAGTDEDEVVASGTAARYGGGEALLGVCLVMLGAFVQALQFVFEEKVMSWDEASAPPLLLIGMEGLWGTLLCLFVFYPLAYYFPGDDHGSFEDPFNTWYMIMHSSTIKWAFLIYFFSIFGYNLFAILVTFSLNSIYHAILDLFRPMSVWGTDMLIFYAFVSLKGEFGEPWTKYSWVQLLGMFVLLYGTAIYNAPNAGSIKLLGQWYAFGANFSDEYDQAEAEIEEERLDREWEEKRQNFGERRTSSLAEVSPYVAMRTSALRSPRI